MASIFHLLLIAIDRVMILLIPFRYQSILTRKRRRTCITVLSILPLVIGITSYLIYELNTPKPLFKKLRNSIITSEPFIRTPNHSISTFEQYVGRLNNSIARINSLIKIPRTRRLSKKPRFQPKPQLVLSIVIVTLDFLMVSCYSTTIYIEWVLWTKET